MELFLKDLKISECDICVSVGDLENSNAAGIVTIEYMHDGSKFVKSHNVHLGFPAQTIRFPKIHRNDRYTTVTATVRSGSFEKSTKSILKFCEQ
jgi:hypothetical protein